MCRVLQVSRSSYYAWLVRPESNRSLERTLFEKRIEQVYHKSKKRYGSPKIAMELKMQGHLISRPRVARIMRSLGLRSIIHKKYRVTTTHSNHSESISPNVLRRNFTVLQAGKVWVSDITYIKVKRGWMYLTIIMDLYDRKIIGWSISNGMSCEETVQKAWGMALINRKPQEGLIFHSDRGIQYTSSLFRSSLRKVNATQSMSRKGDCWDNAIAENFFKILKSECVNHQTFSSSLCTKRELFYFIEAWYNRQRIHSYLGYQTPNDFGKLKMNTAA